MMSVKGDHGGLPAFSFHGKIGRVVLNSPKKSDFTPNTTKSLKVSLKGTSSKAPKGRKMQNLGVDFGAF